MRNSAHYIKSFFEQSHLLISHFMILRDFFKNRDLRSSRILFLLIKSSHLQNRVTTANDESRLSPPSRVGCLSLSFNWVERENVCQSTTVKRSINDITSDFVKINHKFDNLKVFLKFKIINNIIKSFYV